MTVLTSPQAAYTHLKKLHRPDVEEFWCIALSSDKKVIASEMIFRGSVDQCLIHPREIFRFAIKNGASSILISHNHPSGDPWPSASDDAVTAQMVAAGKILEIPVIDHLIIGSYGHYSYQTEGKL